MQVERLKPGRKDQIVLRRDPAKYPIHTEQDCTGTTANMLIGKELYYLSADRELMPTRKNQPPPDLRYFDQVRK